MRGKTALPLTRSGEEFSTSGVPVGSGLAGEGGAGVTPGGSAGGSTNGDAVVGVAVWEATGPAVAAVADGHGSVRNEPRASVFMPFRQRATTRTRYVVEGSRPDSVVRAVSALCATVVGDQIPKRSSTPPSSTTRPGSETCHFTMAEKGRASTSTMSATGARVAFAPLDASAATAPRASMRRTADRRSMRSTSAPCSPPRVPRLREPHWVGIGARRSCVAPRWLFAGFELGVLDVSSRSTPAPAGSVAAVSTAILTTSEGAIELELFDDDAPRTVQNFTKLAPA